MQLGVRDEADLERALDALEAAGAHRFLVESMAPPGVDLIVGAARDPVFGPVVLVGLGGVVAEALADVATPRLRSLPRGAADLLDELAAGRCWTVSAAGRPSTGPRSAASSPRWATWSPATTGWSRSRSTRCGSPRTGYSRSTP